MCLFNEYILLRKFIVLTKIYWYH